MENTVDRIELLLERAVEYSKSSYELAKLSALEKASALVSSFMLQTVVFVMVASFMLFLNLGVAFWVGELLGRVFYGFFAIAAFYGLIGIVLRLFFYNWIKRMIENYVIRKILK